MEPQADFTLGVARRSLLRDLHFGAVKLHVLHHACVGPIYGAGIASDLEQHGYRLSWGTLYPILHSLAAAQLLEREECLVDGKIRKYYSITNVGLQALEDGRRDLARLLEELDSHDCVVSAGSVSADAGSRGSP